MENVEDVKQIEAPKSKSRAWLVVLLFVVVLSALAVAGVTMHVDPAGREAALSTPPVPEFMESEAPEATPALSEEPGDAEETPAPTEAPATPVPTAVYSKTAIVVNGSTCAIVSSRQAAEELIRNAQEHFAAVGNIPEDAYTETNCKIEFREASEDARAMSYDEAYEYLTSPYTPLVFRAVATFVEDTVIPHRDTVIVDTMLPKGLRVARQVGRDGLVRTIRSSVYINGVIQSSSVEETFTVLERIDGDIRVGARVFPADYVLRPGFGSDPLAAHGLGFVAPIHGEIITYYGPKGDEFHHGIDVSVPAYTEVAAACDGEVVTLMERGAYGLMLEIQHANGVTTRYARLTDVSVGIGDTVKAGDIIAKVAPDDHGPHLHFELRVNGTAYNPLKILPSASFKG